MDEIAGLIGACSTALLVVWKIVKESRRHDRAHHADREKVIVLQERLAECNRRARRAERDNSRLREELKEHWQ